MASTTTDKYNITPAVLTTTSRWIPNKVEETEDKKKRSAWTEVVSKHNKRHFNNNNNNHNNEHDPFAGMKSCVDYEQEIERLKQLVPKVMTSSTTTTLDNNNTSRHKRNRSTTSTHSSNTPNNNNNNNHTNTNTNTYNTNNNTTNNNTLFINQPQQQQQHELSRSNSPDTTHSSDSEISLPEPPHSVITEQEKARFLAFVRSWTGDWKGGWGHDDSHQFMDNNSSLWAEQSPWNYSICSSNRHQSINNPLVISNASAAAVNHQQPMETPPPQYDLYWQWNHIQQQQSVQKSYHHWQQQYPLRHGQQPIGMGRSSMTSGNNRGRSNSPYVM